MKQEKGKTFYIWLGIVLLLWWVLPGGRRAVRSWLPEEIRCLGRGVEEFSHAMEQGKPFCRAVAALDELRWDGR